jgi:hypothetical protein
MMDKEHCAGLFLASDTGEKVHTEIPNSLLAAWEILRILKQFEVLTDLREIRKNLKVSPKMYIYTNSRF